MTFAFSRRAILFLSILHLGACGGGETDSRDDREGGACSQPPSQGLSQPCCRQYGIDACGANLFCAAFDGRQQPTCYAERSRPDGEECTADHQCVSASCNVEEGACRASPGMTCDRTVGCADDPTGAPYACASNTCTPVGDGLEGSPCRTADDCKPRFECGEDSLCHR